MGVQPQPHPARLRRLEEELAEAGFEPGGSASWRELLLVELDYALRPLVHERRVPSVGTIIEPTADAAAWEGGTLLNISRGSLGDYPVEGARRFADGMSSFVVRRLDGDDEFVVFDRPAGSERDLVVLADALDATVVQRHPSGIVRLVGDFGVLRWNGLRWHHEPPVRSWVDSVSACAAEGDRRILAKLLAFAVHDLGARGIGALLVYDPDGASSSSYQLRLPTPPPLRIDRVSDLAPLRHVLGQIDGAAVFDCDGVLRELGVRLVPSAAAESDIEGYRGMRHTSARRYSFDEPESTVIVVSEDGPVSVLRKGALLGSSSRHWLPPDLVALDEGS
jgi:hypothetical protein